LSERSKANAYPMIISDRSEKELTRMHSKVNPQIRKSSQSKHRMEDQIDMLLTPLALSGFSSYGNERFATE